MSDYRAPLTDMRFILHEVQGAAEFFSSMTGCQDISRELMDAILDEGAKLCEDLLAPINRQGDEQGCLREGSDVRTPEGFKEAYRAFAAGGWVGLAGDPAFGGQGIPKTVAVLFEEMMMAANSSFALYPILSAGASMALAAHASEALKERYLPKLYSGEWSGTMCLTEPHAGTDLGLIKTRAEVAGSGRYRVSGTKIFITGGEHDLCENILHLVLARLPDAPAGPKGISLFLVPKILVDDTGQLGNRNRVSCGAIEHKMGIKGSATCVMHFEEAEGYLIGNPNEGLHCMFTMMNYERLSIGLQGVGLADSSYQVAATYARDRLQGRRSTGPANPLAPADSILEHPDVRRMLLSVRADVEAGRALAVFLASQLDRVHFHHESAVRERAAKCVAFLIPVAKAMFSDRGFAGCVTAQQVLGGHGYIREWGLEQNVRDARIAQIYEGTNGIQALDLAGRKLVRDREGLLEVVVEEVNAFLRHPVTGEEETAARAVLESLTSQVLEVSRWLKTAGEQHPDEVGAASVPYLQLVGVWMYCFMWVRMLRAAQQALARGEGNAAFYSAKYSTAHYYLHRVVPGALALEAEIKAGSQSLMAMSADQF